MERAPIAQERLCSAAGTVLPAALHQLVLENQVDLGGDFATVQQSRTKGKYLRRRPRVRLRHPCGEQMRRGPVTRLRKLCLLNRGALGEKGGCGAGQGLLEGRKDEREGTRRVEEDLRGARSSWRPSMSTNALATSFSSLDCFRARRQGNGCDCRTCAFKRHGAKKNAPRRPKKDGTARCKKETAVQDDRGNNKTTFRRQLPWSSIESRRLLNVYNNCSTVPLPPPQRR